MREGSEKTREEILLDAIGNLPEDMIAKALEYSPYQREGEGQAEGEKAVFLGEDGGFPERRAGEKSWRRVCRGLAAAACLALVITGANKGGKLFRQYLDGKSVVSDRAEVVHQNAPKFQGDSLNSSGEKNAEVKIWAEAREKDKAMSESKKESDAYNHSNQSVEDSDDTFRKAMKEGVSRRLAVEKVDGGTGEIIPVTKLVFGEGNEQITYSLHSQVNTCRIVSVTEGGVTKYVNLPDADCKPGGTVEFAVERPAGNSIAVSWSTHPVPEWAEKEIEILDIINISVKSENGKKQEAGQFIIGVKGKKYYGVYKSE